MEKLVIMVPAGSVVSMAFGALMGFGVPALLVLWFVKRFKVKIETVLIGAAVFFVFALILESLVHQIVLKGDRGAAITGNIWYYALYGGLMAGLFEETGRYLAMKFLLKKERGAMTGVAYGIGHGGIEMLMLFGVGMVSNLVLSIMINTGSVDTILASVPPEAMDQVEAQFSALETIGAGTVLISLWERISAIVLQLGLSMMVWTAVRRRKFWLYPAAILLHFLVDGVVVVLAKSVNMITVEVVVMCLAIAVGSMAFMLGRKCFADEDN